MFVIATDGNWNYHRLIKCNYRKIVRIIKDNKTGKVIKDKKTGKVIKDKKTGKVKKEITHKYYNNHNKDTIHQNSSYDDCNSLNTFYNHNFIDCNIHIVDKADTQSRKMISLLNHFNLLSCEVATEQAKLVKVRLV